MPEYININPYLVQLLGPNNERITLKSNQKIILNEYYDRYVKRGFIVRVDQMITKRIINQHKSNKIVKPNAASVDIIRKKEAILNRAKKLAKDPTARKRPIATRIGPTKPVVGRTISLDATRFLNESLQRNSFQISNNIGVGILSYNRISSLKRLVESIFKYTDLNKTTVFISDDGSTDMRVKDYIHALERDLNVVVVDNQQNVGVAGNSNRLIRCLSRFKYGIILNDDVEVLQPGWEYLYVEAMKKTGFHHFIYRQDGVYGAKLGDLQKVNDVYVRKTNDRPHGAVLAFSHEMLSRCGYFDSSYGSYGMEHVDWSMKPTEFDLQPSGFFDVNGSNSYFMLHNDKSSVINREQLLKNSREVFARRKIGVKIEPSSESVIPEICYIIPFRNLHRQDSIATVVANIRAQRFPVIHINLVEQDTDSKIDFGNFYPVNYYLAQEKKNTLFNKAKAFNLGVFNANCEKLVLHDADMLVPSNYTSKIFSVLDDYDACHLGKTVIYSTSDTMNAINTSGVVKTGLGCERLVGYYEGGSLACNRKAYWKIGGFNEDFWGYGCEDCDFYERLKSVSKFCDHREFDLFHLWHPRTDGWDMHHTNNKVLSAELCKLSMNERVRRQIEQLRNSGYGKFL